MRFFRTIYSRRSYIAPAVTTLVFLLIITTQAGADTQLVGTKAQHERWTNGLSSLGNGHFSQAYKLINQIKAEGTHDQRVDKVHEWLSTFNQLLSERASRKKADYEK